ncbi:hypothetical protein [Ramlibacter humi]|uniref:Uncharacterized protein n=1 Tax=Ramlibacter humi TaxID=2530451 RepID=A0A4Z0C9U4_9BURK|nr:hypothetical protein [Ramlibacter humi]TFZ07652.1 hypothetical protein EZ216_00345 [Ramlibacter humi]
MKLGELKSLGHNIAGSLASGIGLMIGVYDMNVFAEASSSSEGFVTVDFLNASSTGASVSAKLGRAIVLYKDALPALCAKHGLDLGEIKIVQVRYGVDPVYGPHFTVTVETADGRRSADQYLGVPGRRLRRGHSSRLRDSH